MKYRARAFTFTPPQILVFGFGLIIMIGALLLSLPISTQDGQGMSMVNALFTSTSASCVTGLVVVDTGTYFTVFGQIVIMVLMQVGGIGFVTMATLIALLLRKRISLKERLVLQQALNQNSMEGIIRLIRKVVMYSLIIEAIAAMIFTIRWSAEMSWGKAAYFGVFHAVSLFNNAGFDLFGNFRSFTYFVDDVVINVVVIFLTILGGIGFIVIADLVDYHKNKRLSLHSKVVLWASAILFLLGFVIIFIFEYTNWRTMGPLSTGGKVLASFYQSITPRSSGTSTVDIGSMRQATQFFMIILMFIGAAPGSTGGGIKVTTFTALIGAMVTMIRGREDVVLFRYRLDKDRIYKAVTLTLMAIALVIFMSMLLSTTEDHQFLMILFEVTSAFGTVGLSMGLTADLTPFGKVMITLMMFIGRLGPLTLAYALGSKNEKELYRYPEGKIIIG